MCVCVCVCVCVHVYACVCQEGQDNKILLIASTWLSLTIHDPEFQLVQVVRGHTLGVSEHDGHVLRHAHLHALIRGRYIDIYSVFIYCTWPHAQGK